MTGPRIREARLCHNPPMSQANLAVCLARRGVKLDQAAISRIENRAIIVADYELVAIARCLGVSVAALCGER